MEGKKILNSEQRIVTLDVIRGFAILGILIMNIQSFSMIGQAYLNPTSFGNFEMLNKWVWILSHLVADQKFMSIFSMMFGASIIMISKEIEERNQSSLGLHYKRNLWLLVIGILHSYLVWYGDILVPYAVCAFILFPFRKLSPTILFIVGLSLFFFNSLGEILTGLWVSKLPQQALHELMGGWSPNVDQINQEVNAYLGSYAEQFWQRAKTTVMMQTTYFIHHYSGRVAGLMLMGMSLFKSGFLTGRFESKFYRRTLVYVGSIGAFLVILGIIENFRAGWTIQYSMFLGSQFNYWGSLGMAIAYISAIILICRNNTLNFLTTWLSAIGRTALSNYILQSLICTTIFYGFGFGLFGQVERKWQLFLIPFIWILQLTLSRYWVANYNYGPMEWAWRSLTLGKIQPFKKKNNQ